MPLVRQTHYRLWRIQKRLSANSAVPGDVNGYRAAPNRPQKLCVSHQMLEALLLSGEGAIVGADDDRGIDGAHEVGGGGFAAAVMRGDEHVGVEGFGRF